MKNLPIRIESLIGRRDISRKVMDKTNEAYAELMAELEQRRNNLADNREEMQFKSGVRRKA